MSVIIKGMKMPILCGECPCWHDGWCYAIREKSGSLGVPTWRDMLHPDWCPLVELPEKHNRLLDERKVIWAFNDAILDEAKKTGKCRATWNEVYGIVKTVPTVIEAEGEE